MTLLGYTDGREERKKYGCVYFLEREREREREREIRGGQKEREKHSDLPDRSSITVNLKEKSPYTSHSRRRKSNAISRSHQSFFFLRGETK